MVRHIINNGVTQMSLFSAGAAGAALPAATRLPPDGLSPAEEVPAFEPPPPAAAALIALSAPAPARTPYVAAPPVPTARQPDAADEERLRFRIPPKAALALVRERLSALPTLALGPNELLNRLFQDFSEEDEMITVDGRPLADIAYKLAVSAAVKDLATSQEMPSAPEVRWANLFLPDPPSSPRFEVDVANPLAALYRRNGRAPGMRAEEIRLQEWLDDPRFGNEILARFFLELLIRGKEVNQPTRPIENFETGIAIKRRWYEDVAARGTKPSSLERALDERLNHQQHLDGLRARAELNRFTERLSERLAAIPETGTALIGDIHELHDIAPSLNLESFLALLPQYRMPLSLENAQQLLEQSPATTEWLTIFRAKTILLWHAEPSAVLAELLAHTKNYGTFTAFFRELLAVDPSQFEQQLTDLASCNIDVAPIRKLLEEKFSADRASASRIARAAQHSAQLALPVTAPRDSRQR